MSYDPISGEASNWDDTFTDSNGCTYHKVDWDPYRGNIYEKDDDGTLHDTTKTDFCGHSTEITREWLS